MAYNMTWMDNSTTIFDFYTGINTNLNGLPTILFLTTLFFAAFFITKSSADNGTALGVASFTSLIFASLFWFIGTIGWEIVMIPLFLLLGSIIFKRFFN